MTAAGGPVYYRLSSSTQTEEDVKKQIESGEIWGKAPRWSTIPKVKAYAGHLPKGGTGIEFTTDVSPDPDGIPTQPTWSGPRRGVRVEGEYAKIRARIVRVVRSSDDEAVPTD